jgi:two-component system response regulator QseB
MRRPGTVLFKADIEEGLFGWREEIESNAIEVQVHHLRQKLGAKVIETLRGVGYRLAGSAA